MKQKDMESACSAFTQEGMKELFEEAVKQAIKKEKRTVVAMEPLPEGWTTVDGGSALQWAGEEPQGLHFCDPPSPILEQGGRAPKE